MKFIEDFVLFLMPLSGLFIAKPQIDGEVMFERVLRQNSAVEKSEYLTDKLDFQSHPYLSSIEIDRAHALKKVGICVSRRNCLIS